MYLGCDNDEEVEVSDEKKYLLGLVYLRSTAPRPFRDREMIPPAHVKLAIPSRFVMETLLS